MNRGLSTASGDKVSNLISSLDGTQWVGEAKARRRNGKSGLGSNDANMSFEMHDGRLFYLSDIFISDKLVEKAAMGICEFSPPREAVFRLDEKGNVIGDIVLPERVRFKSGELSEVKYYKAPLLTVELSGENLSFTAQPFLGVDKLGTFKQTKVDSKLKKGSSTKTADLAEKLRHCLKHKTWRSKK